MRTSLTRSPWLVEQQSFDAMMLICFPHAGGSASQYYAWQALLETKLQVAAVQLPGRGGRYREPLVRSVRAAAEEVVAVLASRQSRPFALFGHSLGGLLAFEVTRQCMEQGLRRPERLFVAGATPPTHLACVERISHLPDDELLSLVFRMNGLPEKPAADEGELVRLLLPVLRADLALEEDYVCEIGNEIDVPITAFAGRDDRVVPPEIMHDWGAVTRGGCRTRVVEGNHFFVDSHRDKVVTLICAELGLLQTSSSHGN